MEPMITRALAAIALAANAVVCVLTYYQARNAARLRADIDERLRRYQHLRAPKITDFAREHGVSAEVAFGIAGDVKE